MFSKKHLLPALLLSLCGLTACDPTGAEDFEPAELEVFDSSLLEDSPIFGQAEEAPCDSEVHTTEAFDSLNDLTVEELVNAPEGYLAMAALGGDNESCYADSTEFNVQVAEGIAPSRLVSSLCVDEQDASGRYTLRECDLDEPPLWSSWITTSGEDETEAGCYFCTGSTCINNSALKQRKEGTIRACFPNFWDQCCWAFNGGCC